MGCLLFNVDALGWPIRLHARKVNIKNKAERRQLQKHVFPTDGVRCPFGWTACCSMLRRQQLECRWCSCLRFTCARRWPSRRSRCLTSAKRLRCLFSNPAAFLAGCTSTNSARPQSVGRSRTATTSSHATFMEQRCELRCRASRVGRMFERCVLSHSRHRCCLLLL